jgi:hypothetical protein
MAMTSKPVEIVHNWRRRHFRPSHRPGIAVAFAHGSGDRRMTARRVVTAQREAARQRGAPPVVTAPAAAEPVATAQITWGELGCPRDTGLYRPAGRTDQLQVRVKWIHILAAEGDPLALFTVVVLRPPLGPAELVLGHRLA